MNRKQLVILLVLVVVVGGAGLLLRKKQDAAWKGEELAMGQKLLPNLNVNDIAHVSLKQGTNDLNLEKKDDLWRVRERGGYPANFSELTDFLLKARDLKVVHSEKVGPSQWSRLALVAGEGSNTALVVEFRDKTDKPISTMFLGKKHMKKSDRPSPYGEMGGDEGYPDGRYIRVGEKSDSVALISEALANIEPKPEQWLNKDFFKVEKLRSVAVAFPAATNSWKISRETETGEWKLADPMPGEQLDNNKASGAGNQLASATFMDVAAGATPESLGLDKPTLATLETFDEFTYTLKAGPKTNENYPVLVAVTAQLPKERTPGKDEKPEEKARLDKEFKEKQTKLEEKLAQEKALEKWTFLVSAWTLDSLLKERGQLMAEKKEEQKKDEHKSEASPDPFPLVPPVEPDKTNSPAPPKQP